MGRLMDVAVIGIVLVTFAQTGVIPGSEEFNQWVAVIGIAITFFAMATNLVVLITRRSQVNDELNESTQDRGQDSSRR